MKIILFANTDWYLYNFRRSLALELRRCGEDVVLLSPPGPYGEQLQALGFRWIAAPMDRRSLNPWREVLLVEWLRRLVRGEHADLVHGFTIKCAVYGSLAARMAGARGRVNSITGMGYVFTSNDAKARALRPVVKGLLKLALDGPGSRLILQNHDDLEMFQRNHLVAPERVCLIRGSGVDMQRFFPANGEGAAPGHTPLRVLLPARMLWDKGLREYVEAARLLRAQGRPIEFLLAGDPDPGNPAAVPVPALREWEAEGLVRWLGHQDDMPALFRSVDVVVMPSYREGLPKGLIEAAACGLPLVTTDVPGCREVVTDQVDGLLVPVRDPAALAQAIATLQDSPELRARLGAAARAKASEEFDERSVVARTIAVYRELVPAA